MTPLLCKRFSISLLFIIITASAASESANKEITAAWSEGTLIAPTFDFSANPDPKGCGNEIFFRYKNDNKGSKTEIWRSRYPDSDFGLVAVRENERLYIDEGLQSRKTYYYKLRAVKGDEISDFSDVAGFDSGAKWFDPSLEMILLPDNSVEGTLIDRSYLELNYMVTYQDGEWGGWFIC